jgi:hypothetical protein
MDVTGSLPLGTLRRTREEAALLYRALQHLDGTNPQIRRGEIFPGSRLKSAAIPILVEREAISEVSAPPLTILPGWTRRAEKLAAKGIITLDQFIETDSSEIAKVFKAATADTIDTWKREALALLRTPEKTTG